MSAKAKNRRSRIEIKDVIYKRYKSKIEDVNELDRKLEEIKQRLFSKERPESLELIFFEGKTIIDTRSCLLDEIKFLREVLELPQ